MMKKGFILSASLIAALMLASCGSNKESAYKKAYEKAKAQEQAQGGENCYTVDSYRQLR